MLDMYHLFNNCFWMITVMFAVLALTAIAIGARTIYRFHKSGGMPPRPKPKKAYGQLVEVKVGGKAYWSR